MLTQEAIAERARDENKSTIKKKLLKPNRITGAPVTYYVRKNKVFVRIDLVSGYFCVEGSKPTYDDLFTFRDLD